MFSLMQKFKFRTAFCRMQNMCMFLNNSVRQTYNLATHFALNVYRHAKHIICLGILL